MQFIPNYKLQVIKDGEFQEEIAKVETILENYKHTGEFFAFDGTKIYYEYFLTQNAKANIVIVHGLSEFCKKFYEAIYYFLNQGYNVFIYDQRCHGLSGRLTDTIDLLHVDRFTDYAKDLNQFIGTVVAPANDLPLYLYAHSMGCAVSVLYMANYENAVQKAVFSAPMFAPVVKSVPTWLGLVTMWLGKVFVGSKKRTFISRDFNPDTPYTPTNCTSEARYRHNMKLRTENENYQSTPMSYGWTYGSLVVKNAVLKRRNFRKLNLPILLLSGQQDTTVKNSVQKTFADRCKNCEMVEIPGETHALLASHSGQLEETFKRILAFFATA